MAPTPPKKTLEAFLEEFEARLKQAPGEPATSAGLVLEQRAAGVRTSTVESQEGYPRFRPGRVPEASATLPASPQPEAPPPATEESATPGRHRRRRHKHRRHGH